MTPATAAALLRGDVAAKKEDPGESGWRLPRPDRDERDPNGKIESVLLSALGVAADSADRLAYKRSHPNFAQLYEELLEQGLDAALHSRELRPDVDTFLHGHGR